MNKRVKDGESLTTKIGLQLKCFKVSGDTNLGGTADYNVNSSQG